MTEIKDLPDFELLNKLDESVEECVRPYSELMEELAERLTKLRGIEWKYKDLCK